MFGVNEKFSTVLSFYLIPNTNNNNNNNDQSTKRRSLEMQ